MYFAKPGPANTAQTIDLALRAAAEHAVSHLVVASHSGATALLLKQAPQQVVCVTHATGFAVPGQNELTAEARAALLAAGMQIFTGTHALSGAERGLSAKAGGLYPVEIIANSLRMFGQGVKVCLEVAVMALDAGLLPYGRPVIAIGGSGRGADTALLLTPSHAATILDSKIHRLICKPEL